MRCRWPPGAVSFDRAPSAINTLTSSTTGYEFFSSIFRNSFLVWRLLAITDLWKSTVYLGGARGEDWGLESPELQVAFHALRGETWVSLGWVCRTRIFLCLEIAQLHCAWSVRL